MQSIQNIISNQYFQCGIKALGVGGKIGWTVLRYTAPPLLSLTKTIVGPLLPIQTMKTAALVLGGTAIAGIGYKVYQLPVIGHVLGFVFSPIGIMANLIGSSIENSIESVVKTIFTSIGEFITENGGPGRALMVVGNFAGRATWRICVDMVKNTEAKTWAIVGTYFSALFAIHYTRKIFNELLLYYSASARHAIGAPSLTTEYRRAGGLSYPAQLLSRYFIQKPLEPIFNESVQKRLDLISYRIKNRKAGENLGNLLLEGPAGTGKTMFGRILAQQSDCNYIVMSGGDPQAYIPKGSHVSEFNKMLAFARKGPKPTVFFIDEADALCRDRDDLDQPRRELLNAFLKETGSGSDKIMFVLATNRRKDLDFAVVNRMDDVVYIGKPDYQCRVKILDQAIKAEPRFKNTPELTGCLNEQAIKAIAAKTYGISGRTLTKMVDKFAALKRHSKSVLTEEMIDEAVDIFVKQERGATLVERAWYRVQSLGNTMVTPLWDIWYFAILPLTKMCRRTVRNLGNWTWSVIDPHE